MDRHYVMKTPHQLRALLTPLRLDLVGRLIKEPTTALQLSKDMKLSPTKLYYHLHALEKHGMIKVVKTERKRNFVEKTYQAVAKYYTVPRDPLQWTKGLKQAFGDALSTILESTAQGVESVRQKGAEPFLKDRGILSISGYRLKAKDAKDFRQGILKLMKKYGAKDREGNEERVGLTVVMYRE